MISMSDDNEMTVNAGGTFKLQKTKRESDLQHYQSGVLLLSFVTGVGYILRGLCEKKLFIVSLVTLVTFGPPPDNTW
jgi:hypothetical protein